jgi:hypothetical protein
MFDTGSTIYLNDSSDADNLPKMSDTAFLLEVLEYENVLERTHAETQVLPAPLDSTQSGLFARPRHPQGYPQNAVLQFGPE